MNKFKLHHVFILTFQMYIEILCSLIFMDIADYIINFYKIDKNWGNILK